jgi:hypothetical protein
MFSGGARKPSPMVRAAVAPTPDQVAAAGAAAILAQETAQYSGKWGGRAQIAGRGKCTFSLEIKTQPNTAKPFAGYSNLLCIDMTFPAGTKMDPAAIAILTAEKVAPSSTLLSGNVTNGSIAYLTDKVVSRDCKKCDMESMDVTPFGSGQLAAQWKDNGGCGQMN